LSDRIFEYHDHWLVKRTDTPNYHIYWCKPGTRRVRRKSTNTADFERAKECLIEFAEKKRRPTDQPPDDALILDGLNDYVELDMAGRASEKNSRSSLRIWSRFLSLSDVCFTSELTLDLQNEFIEWRRETMQSPRGTPSNAAILRDIAVLSAALNRMVVRRKLAVAPFIQRIPPPPARDRFLTLDELDRLFSACEEPHLLLFVQLALHTVQRPSAIFRLRAERVFLERRRIEFRAPGEAVTNKKKATVRIGDALYGILSKAVERSQSGFVVEYQGQPIQGVRRSFRAACKRAGLGDEVVPYTLRHTGSTLLAANGVPLWQLSGMLGHSLQRTTEIYAKHSPEFMQHATEMADKLFGGLGGRDAARQTRAKRGESEKCLAA